MGHLAILVGLIASFLTLAAALHAWWLHRELRAAVTGAFALFMGLICAADMAELITHYLSANAGIEGVQFNLVASFAIAVPTLLAVLVLVRLSERILGKSFPFAPFLIATLAIVQLAAHWIGDTGVGSPAVTAGVVQLTQALVLCVLLWLSANLILEKGKETALAHRPAAWLGLWIAARPAFEMPIYAMTSSGWLSYDVAVFMLAIVEALSALAVLVGARRVAARLIVADPSGAPDWARLTPREREVAELIAKGLSNKEAARELTVSPATVRDHLSNIYRKTGLRNRVELSNYIQRI
jgi:DNA-binding CsgD family transcriptional regulator